MDDLNAIISFVRVVQANSFAGAARRLGMSPSQLSKQISRLEQQLGTRLLRRTTRSLSLTEAGSIYYGHGTRIVEELESSREAVTRLQSEPSGHLRISALPSMTHSVIVPALPDLLARYPALDVEVVAGERMVDLAEDGFDLALRITKEPPPGVVAKALCPVNYRLCASPDYLARNGSPQTPDDLHGHDLLGYPKSLVPMSWQFTTAMTTLRPLRFRFEINSVEALLLLARRGTGIAVLPTYAAGPALRAGELVEVLPGELVLAGHMLYAIYLPNRFGSPKIRAFMEFLADCIGAPPRWDEGLVTAD